MAADLIREKGFICESDRIRDRFPCFECLADNVYTRIYINRKLIRSYYLCRNCATDYVEKKGYELLIVPFLKPSDIFVGPSPPKTQEEWQNLTTPSSNPGDPKD